MAKTGFYSASMKQMFCDELATRFGTQVSRSDVLKLATEKGYPPPYWFVNDKARSIGRGMFRTDSGAGGAPVELSPELFSSNTVQPEAQVALAATVTPIRRNMESM